MQVLIVDDDINFAHAAIRGFEREGYQASCALNAQDALALAAQKPQWVLLDLNLQATSGLLLLPELRQSLDADARIVILTGYSSIATAVEATRLGADDYLCKPTKLKDIIASFRGERDPSPQIPSEPPSVERLKWEHIQRVLLENEGNVSATARALNMHRRTLQRILSKKPVNR